MRDEQQMMDLILGFAERDERVRSVILNGSRAVPSAPRDIYQDFDIVYVVRELASFLAVPGWIDRFGKRVMLQKPVEMAGNFNGVNGSVYNYLMLFVDGNRIDLTLVTPDSLPKIIESDPVGIPLLDKDGLLEGTAFAEEDVYWVRRPTSVQFENTCNNFWWVLQNTAKGILRDEIPYALEMLGVSRAALTEIVCWHIGELSGGTAIPGKCGKYIGKWLDPVLFRFYLDTWPRADTGCIRASMVAASSLFRKLAVGLAGRLQYRYPHNDDARMCGYLNALLNTEEF